MFTLLDWPLADALGLLPPHAPPKDAVQVLRTSSVEDPCKNVPVILFNAGHPLTIDMSDDEGVYALDIPPGRFAQAVVIDLRGRPWRQRPIQSFVGEVAAIGAMLNEPMPIAGATVRLRSDKDGFLAMTTTDASGCYRLRPDDLGEVGSLDSIDDLTLLIHPSEEMRGDAIVGGARYVLTPQGAAS